MLCYREFPDYPAAAMPPLPDGWHDLSWHNDTCPRYMRDDGRVCIWIDYPDDDAREFHGFPRFAVVIDDNDGAVYGTDDWTDALAVASAVLPPPPPVLTLV